MHKAIRLYTSLTLGTSTLFLSACPAPQQPKVKVIFIDPSATAQSPDFKTYTVTGQIQWPEGIPPQKTQVEIENTPLSTQTDSQGHFTLKNIPTTPDQHLNAFSILSDGSRYSLRQPITPASANLNLESLLLQKSGSITGIVSTADNSNRLGIAVFIPGTTYSAFTDADGAFFIAQIPPGEYSLVAQQGKRQSSQQPVEVKAGHISPIELQLPTSGTSENPLESTLNHTLKGLITAGGNPVQGVSMRVLETNQVTLSDDSGQFEIKLTTDVEIYTLELLHPQYLPQRFTVTPTGETLNLDLQPKSAEKTGTIEGILRDTQGNPLPQTEVETIPPTQTIKTDEQGQFTLPNIPSGAYYLRGKQADETLVSGVVSVQPGSTSSPEFQEIIPYGKQPLCLQENTNNINIEAPGSEVVVNVNNENTCLEGDS